MKCAVREHTHAIVAYLLCPMAVAHNMKRTTKSVIPVSLSAMRWEFYRTREYHKSHTVPAAVHFEQQRTHIHLFIISHGRINLASCPFSRWKYCSCRLNSDAVNCLSKSTFSVESEKWNQLREIEQRHLFAGSVSQLIY